MTPQQLKQFNKQNEETVIKVLKELPWHQSPKHKNKAGVLVEDIIPILQGFIADKRLKEGDL